MYESSKLAHPKLNLDDANLVGDIEGVVVSGEAHVGLLLAVGADKIAHERSSLDATKENKASQKQRKIAALILPYSLNTYA